MRTLIAHEETDYEEWGASGAARIDPGASGRGLSLTVRSSWGAVASGTERLWSFSDARGFSPDGDFDAGRRLEAEVGYGLGLSAGPGVLTPYAGLSLGEGGGRAWRTGARWQLAPGATLSLEGTRAEAASDAARSELGVDLNLTARW